MMRDTAILEMVAMRFPFPSGIPPERSCLHQAVKKLMGQPLPTLA